MSTLLRKFSRIYIIGEMTSPVTIQQRRKYSNAQIALEHRGFEVVNPILKHGHELIDLEEILRMGLPELFNCGSVYVLEDVSFTKGNSVELKIAMDLNLVVFHEVPNYEAAPEEDFLYSSERAIPAMLVIER